MRGFIQGSSIEREHLQFCKRLLGVKRTTQNNVLYMVSWEGTLLGTSI